MFFQKPQKGAVFHIFSPYRKFAFLCLVAILRSILFRTLCMRLALKWLVLGGMISSVLLGSFGFAFERFGNSDEVITNDIDDVVGDDIQNSDDPLRDGTEIIAKGVGDADDNDEIYYEEVTTTKEARTKTANFIKAIINYALGAIGLVALVYIIYHGFLTATAAGNEDQEKK